MKPASSAPEEMGGDNKSPAHGQIEKTESKLPKLSLSGWAILHSGYARCAGSMLPNPASSALRQDRRRTRSRRRKRPPPGGRARRLNRVAAIRGTHRAHGCGMADLARD